MTATKIRFSLAAVTAVSHACKAGLFLGLLIAAFGVGADILLGVLTTLPVHQESWPGFTRFVVDSFMVAVITPIVETWLFQYFVIEAVGRATPRKSTLGIFLSMLLFGLVHLYSPGGRIGIIAFPIGWLLAYIYSVAGKRSRMLGFVVAAVAHATNNAIFCAALFYFEAP